MVQIVEGNPSVWGRIGKGLGNALAEHVPKYIERKQLSDDLKQLEQDAPNLSPLQQYTRAATVRGATPAFIQGLPEVLKNQSTRDAYMKKAAGGQRDRDGTNAGHVPKSRLDEVKFAGLEERPQGRSEKEPNLQPKPGEAGTPAQIENAALRPETETVGRWSPERKAQEVSRVFEDFPNATLQEANALANENEQREMEQPLAARQEDDRLAKKRQELKDELKSQIETKLQKKGDEIYSDISGENLVKLEREMERYVRENPGVTARDAANHFSNLGLNYAKTKGKINELANRDIFDRIFKGEQTYDKLKGAQKIYAETGNQEEFYNKLKSDIIPAKIDEKGNIIEPEQRGFNMSPGEASKAAYPLSKSASSLVSNHNRSTVSNRSENARKAAIDVEKSLTSKDSILTIAQSLKDKDPLFDQRAFFAQLREDQDRLGINSRQKDQILEGEGNIFPTWGDVFLVPSKPVRSYL